MREGFRHAEPVRLRGCTGLEMRQQDDARWGRLVHPVDGIHRRQQVANATLDGPVKHRAEAVGGGESRQQVRRLVLERNRARMRVKQPGCRVDKREFIAEQPPARPAERRAECAFARPGIAGHQHRLAVACDRAGVQQQIAVHPGSELKVHAHFERQQAMFNRLRGHAWQFDVTQQLEFRADPAAEH